MKITLKFAGTTPGGPVMMEDTVLNRYHPPVRHWLLCRNGTPITHSKLDRGNAIAMLCALRQREG